MASKNPVLAGVSRRSFITTSAVAAGAVAVSGRSLFAAAAPAMSPNSVAASNYAKALVEKYGKPNSKFDGVQVGTITYSYRSMPSSAEDLLKYCVISGISAIEMMGAPADGYLSGATGGGRGGLPNASPAQNDAYAAMTTALAPLTTALGTARTNLAAASLKVPADKAAIAAAADAVAKADLALSDERRAQLAKIQASANKLSADQLVAVGTANGVPAAGGGRGGGRGGAGGAPAPMPAWMTPANLTKLADLRRMYNEAGVMIYALKNIGGGQSDGELDYRLEMAKTLGATHDTLELPTDNAVIERLGSFGVKHGIKIGYHTHTQARIDSFDTAMKLSPATVLNVDTGHYWAGNGSSAIPLLRKYADRVGSIHLKDRTGPTKGEQNLMWGTGETDIVEILRTIRSEKWNFPASCELEYQIPPGSNAVIEVARCRGYAGAALMT